MSAQKEETRGGYRSWHSFSEDARERFLELIADGKTRQEAAKDLAGEFPDIHSTASRWKGLVFRDEEFAERYVAALELAGKETTAVHRRVAELEKGRLAHRLWDEAIIRALDSEKGKVGASNRVLYNLSLLTVDSFGPLLEARTKHIHEGSIGIYALPQIDAERWSLEEHEEFVALEARRNELLERARPEDAPPIRSALPVGAEIVDAEFEEIVDATH